MDYNACSVGFSTKLFCATGIIQEKCLLNDILKIKLTLKKSGFMKIDHFALLDFLCEECVVTMFFVNI